jgi:DEAD/DEAH box helicase domain-containing protein
MSESEVAICSEQTSQALGRGAVHRGVIDVHTQVVAYLRRNVATGQVIERIALDLPTRTLRTQATWFTLPSAARPSKRTRAGAHAAEHVLLSLLAAVAGSDRSDVAGAFSVRHPDTDALTVFVYDTSPGGAGFAAAGYARAEQWLATARERLDRCHCDVGCPRCCVTAGCPTANNDVDRTAGLVLLRAWSKAVPAAHLKPPSIVTMSS